IGLALDASTHRVFVATQSGAAIVDGATGTVLATRSSLGPSDAWWQVAHDATRHRVYVANGNISGSPSLVVLDDTDLSLVANVALPAIPRLALAVDAPRGLVYVGGFASGSSSFGSVYTVNETTLEVTKSLDVGNGVATPFS